MIFTRLNVNQTGRWRPSFLGATEVLVSISIVVTLLGHINTYRTYGLVAEKYMKEVVLNVKTLCYFLNIKTQYD